MLRPFPRLVIVTIVAQTVVSGSRPLLSCKALAFDASWLVVCLSLLAPQCLTSLVAGSALLGLGHLCSMLGIQTLIARTEDGAQRDRRFSVFTIVNSTGQMLAPAAVSLSAGQRRVRGRRRGLVLREPGVRRGLRCRRRGPGGLCRPRPFPTEPGRQGGPSGTTPARRLSYGAEGAAQRAAVGADRRPAPGRAESRIPDGACRDAPADPSADPAPFALPQHAGRRGRPRRVAVGRPAAGALSADGRHRLPSWPRPADHSRLGGRTRAGR